MQKDEVDDEKDPLPRSHWVTRAEAARLRNCSLTTIRTLERRGLITAKLVHGTWRIDPRELEDVGAEDIDRGNTDMAVADLLREAFNGMKAAQAHNEALMALVVAPSKGLQEGWNTLNGALIARLNVVETAYDSLRKTSEEALSLQHERHLAERAFDASQKRKNVAFETVMKQVPDVAKVGIAAVMKATGMPIPPSVAANAPAAAAAPPSASPPAAAPATAPEPAVTIPDGPPPPAQSPEVEEESSFLVTAKIARMTDAQIEQLLSFGVLTRAEADAFRVYRASIHRAAMAPSAEPAIDTTGESVEP